MSDPIHELRELAHQGVDVTPLPPSEVRRRGERMRRRHNALAALGGVAAIALIATPIAIIAGGSNQALPPANPSSPTVTTTQSATPGRWRTTIPAGFPLAQGWPEPTEPGDGLGIAGPSRNLAVDEPGAMCPATAVSVPAPVDELAATWTQPADYRSRQLLLFADDTQAHQYADWLRDTFANCEGVESGDGYIISASVQDYQPVTFAWNATLRSELQGAPAPGIQLVQVAVVGNAVLVNAGSDEGSDAQAMNNEYAGQAVDVLAAMDVFEGAPQATEPAQTTAPLGDIPADFPLAAGWPDPSTSEYGDEALEGPNRTLPPLDLSACGHKVPDPGDTDRLNATWTNVEDYRGRELLTFSTAQEAVTYVAHLRAVWADCPVEESGDGGIRRQLRATSVGGESVALISTYEYAGKPALGLGINHVIRLGRAVLVDTASNEGTESAIDDQLARMTAASAPVVDAMCVFTEAGC